MSSKADKLGAGRFGAERTVSARRAAVAAATGVPTAGVAPPTQLPPHRISLNPDNPRSSLGDLTDLAGSLKDHGQKVAITVMNRDAYLRANPRKEADLEPNTTHVVIDGSSRLAAARDAGLTTVKVMVDDDQGADEDGLLESALVANIHRQDLDALDEARALKRLLDIHGSQRALAKRLHRSQGWVSQRLALLGLTPELAQRLADGTESVDLLRAVGNKPAEMQQEALEELKQARARKDAPKRQPAPETTAGDYGVITPARAEAGGAGSGSPAAGGGQDVRLPVGPSRRAEAATEAMPLRATPPAESVPEPRAEVLPPGTPMPYDNPTRIAMHLPRKMTPPDFLEAWLQMGVHLRQSSTAEEWDATQAELANRTAQADR